MKKILTLLAVTFTCITLKAQVVAPGVIAGTVTTPNGALSGTTNVFLLTTNRASVYNITLSSTASGVAQFYDSDNTNAPFFGMFYTNDIYVSRGAYPTNYVTSYIGQNGYTNWYTNALMWTYNITNAANTNALSPQFAIAFGANIPVSVNVDALFSKGITMRTTTNVNYTVLSKPGM